MAFGKNLIAGLLIFFYIFNGIKEQANAIFKSVL